MLITVQIRQIWPDLRSRIHLFGDTGNAWSHGMLKARLTV